MAMIAIKHRSTLRFAASNESGTNNELAGLAGGCRADRNPVIRDLLVMTCGSPQRASPSESTVGVETRLQVCMHDVSTGSGWQLDARRTAADAVQLCSSETPHEYLSLCPIAPEPGYWLVRLRPRRVACGVIAGVNPAALNVLRLPRP